MSSKDYGPSSSSYLELLKKVLIDYQNIGYREYHPLEIVDPNWKTFFLYPIHRLLKTRNFAISKVKPVKRHERLNGIDWPAQALTMIGYKRLSNIEACIRIVREENIQGDLIETGVWRGGAVMFMKAVLNELQIKDKKV